MAIASWTRTKEHVWSNLLISLESFSIDAGIQECILQRSTYIYPWNFRSNLVNKKMKMLEKFTFLNDKSTRECILYRKETYFHEFFLKRQSIILISWKGFQQRKYLGTRNRFPFFCFSSIFPGTKQTKKGELPWKRIWGQTIWWLGRAKGRRKWGAILDHQQEYLELVGFGGTESWCTRGPPSWGPSSTNLP